MSGDPDEQLIRRAYFNTLRCLAACAVFLTGKHAEKCRKLITREFYRAKKIFPGFKWVRSVNHFVVWIEDDPDDDLIL